jgi:hypothetical protein
MITFRLKYFFPATFLFLVEVLIALFVHDRIVRPYVGDVLVVILIYCVVKSFLDCPVLYAAWSVLIFAYLVETLQYFNVLVYLGLAHSKSANIIVGNSFSWMDILAYTLGISIVLGTERFLFKHKTFRKTSVPLFI